MEPVSSFQFDEAHKSPSSFLTPEQLIAQLRQENDRLRRELEFKNDYLSNMGHELRTPLNAVLGLTEALQEQIHGEMNSNQLRLLNGIGESGRQLLSLITDVVDVAKVDAGNAQLNEEPVSAESLCRSVVQGVKQVAQKKKLNISHKVSNVETFLGDSRRLKQILTHLMRNAVQFTPTGGHIGIEISADEGKNEIRLRVWDTGVGMPEMQVRRLFRTANNSLMNSKPEAVGLGLTVVNKLTKLHNGTITIQSAEGRGSIFTVAIPWRRLSDMQLEPLSSLTGNYRFGANGPTNRWG